MESKKKKELIIDIITLISEQFNHSKIEDFSSTEDILHLKFGNAYLEYIESKETLYIRRKRDSILLLDATIYLNEMPFSVLKAYLLALVSYRNED